MNSLVAIAYVPDTESRIKVAADGRSLDETDVKWIVSPYAEYALEEAIKTKEAEALFVALGWQRLADLGEKQVHQRLVLFSWACTALDDLPQFGAIDVASDALPFHIVPTVTAIRLVVHRNDDAPQGSLIGALRAADLDARIIHVDLTAGRGTEAAAASATETFVLELVATIGRRTTDGAGDP